MSRKIRRPASAAIGATGHERFATAGALSVIRQARRRQERKGHGFVASVTGLAAPPADGIEPRGVSDAGR